MAAMFVAILSGCTRNGINATASYNPGYGPFDQNGNYVEAWADKPAKKHWWSKKTPTPKPTPTATPTRNNPMLIASNSPRLMSPPRVANSPIRRPASSPRSKPTPPPVVSTPSPKPIVRPKPTPTKPKPKPVVRHLVKKGDTLYSLGRHYGTSVSSIQHANGISGTNIRLGQTLKIPK